MPFQLFTAEQCAELLGLHRSRLYTAISTHVVTPTARAGRSYAFHADSLPAILNKLRPFITAEEYDRGTQNLILNGFFEPDQKKTMKEKNQMIQSILNSRHEANPPATHEPIGRPIPLPPGCTPETKKLFRTLSEFTDPFSSTKFVREVRANGAWDLAIYDVDRQLAANPGWQAPISKAGPNHRRLTPEDCNHV